MPARNSSMELPSPVPESTGASTRRKSGRVAQKPQVLSPSSAAGSKRKRGDADTDVEMGDAAEEDEEEESSEESEGEPDPEELKERRKKARNQKKAAPKKPAPKKAKQTNGNTLSLAIRSAKPKASRKKPQHQTADAEAVGGLYGESS